MIISDKWRKKLNIIIMILLISFLVIIHELGHFFTAKFFKMKVDKFGFGLPVGPTLFRKKIGETEFLVHALLLGGYVGFPDDDKENNLDENSPERFMNKPIYQRAIVLSAGVFANFLCAVFIVLLAAGIWHKLPSGTYETMISKILPNAEISVKQSGMQTGDKIYSINGTTLQYPNVLTKYLEYSKPYDGKVNKEHEEEVFAQITELNGKLSSDKTLPVGTVVKLPKLSNEPPVYMTKDEIIGFEVYKSNEIELTEEQQALNVKLRNKSEYKTEEPVTLNDIAMAYSDNRKPIEITVLRNDNKLALKPMYPNQDGILGIERTIIEIMNPIQNPGDMFKYSWKYLKTNSDMMLYGLGKIFTGRVPLEEMHGIVAITKIGGDVIEHQGLFKGLLLTAIISLNLAYLNLLPIPALDGGHLLFLLIEKIQGKKVNEKVAEIIANFFFYLLILLMIFIIFNDVFALITNKI